MALLKNNRNSRVPWIISGVTLFLGILISIKLADSDARRNLEVDRSRATVELAAVRTRLEAVVNSVFSATSGIVNVISHQGSIAPDLFDSMAARTVNTHPYIRNIAVAPDNVISRIFPLAGNERALGLDYKTIPEQYKTVLQAMRSGQPKLGGPFHLVQGGDGLILRAPVFTDSKNYENGSRYWGVVSVVVDINSVLDAGGLRSAETLDIALRRSDEKDIPGAMIWGSQEILSLDPVSMKIIVPGGEWEIAAIRKSGWSGGRLLPTRTLYAGIFNSLLLAGLIWSLATHQRRIMNENRQLQQEIAERTEVEEKLKLSQQKYQNIFSLMPDMVGITRMSDGKLIEVNAGFEACTGWKNTEALGRTSLELGLWDPETRAKAISIVRETGRLENFEFMLGTRSGEKRNALMYLTPIKVEGEECLYFMAHDITSLKQAQSIIENERLRFKNLVDSVDGIVWEADAVTFTFTYVSQQAERLLGYPVEDWYQTGFWAEHLYPDDREWAPTFCADRTRLLEDHFFEYRFVAKDGSIVWLHDIVTVVEEEGQPRWLRGVMVDTTGKKLEELEKQKLEAQLRQAQKMEAIGRLAGGVAHDFNNKLAVILGYVEMAQRASVGSDRYLNHLDQALKAAGQARDITRQLLAFSRQEPITPCVLNLNDLVTDSKQGLCRFIGEDIRFEIRLGESLWPVNMDPGQVDQVIMNLVVNARDAMADGGLLLVETGNIKIDCRYSQANPEVIPGEYVRLTVSDTGCGMGSEIRQHIFEPFYTTKAAGKGTGLGLATIYGIVSQNGGFVNVYSEPGIGTTFSVYFPRSDDPMLAAQVVEPDIYLQRSATILLVEDEESVREMVAELLKEIGYNLLVAATPLEALKICSDDNCKPELLLTDVIMPEMNGRQLAQRVKELKPGIKVLFMSGYTADIIDQKGILGEGINFIQKPFGESDLHAKIQQVLKETAQ